MTGMGSGEIGLGNENLLLFVKKYFFMIVL